MQKYDSLAKAKDWRCNHNWNFQDWDWENQTVGNTCQYKHHRLTKKRWQRQPKRISKVEKPKQSVKLGNTKSIHWQKRKVGDTTSLRKSNGLHYFSWQYKVIRWQERKIGDATKHWIYKKNTQEQKTIIGCITKHTQEQKKNIGIRGSITKRTQWHKSSRNHRNHENRQNRPK